MEKVLGIGGLFFRAKAPEKLAKWYQDHLGVAPVPQNAGTAPWEATGGATVFAPFDKDTEYFPKGTSFMVNFRVANLDRMLAQLENAGIPTRPMGDMPGVGRFAHLDDPEGNAIELWEPAQG